MITADMQTRSIGTAHSRVSGRDATDSRENNKAAQVLTRLLADTYVVANATQVLEWNVPELEASDLGQLLHRQRQELSSALDRIAARIRTLGFRVLGTLDLIPALSADGPPDVSRTGRELFGALKDRHVTIVEEIREATSAMDKSADNETMDLLQRRLVWHEDAISALEQASLPLWGAL